MSDKTALRVISAIILAVFLVAVFYQRPEQTQKVADYLPAAGFIGNPEQGRQLFSQHCISCHGQLLQGTDKGPSLLHDYYKPLHHGDVAIYMAVRQGVQQHHWQFGDMPAVPELSPEDAGQLVAYIRQQQRRAGLID